MWLFIISLWYYTALGTIAVIMIGLVVSWLSEDNDNVTDPDLFSPLVHRFLPKNHEKNQYSSVEKAVQLLQTSTTAVEETEKVALEPASVLNNLLSDEKLKSNKNRRCSVRK